MNKIIVTLSAFLMILSSEMRAQDYQLVWSDEFNVEGRLDSTLWNYERGYARNEELQWYQPDNAYCKGGHLIIEARREERPNPMYREGARDWRRSRKNIECTSSSVTTSGKKEFLYGRFEVRARIPVGKGAWPAIWTLGREMEWPSNGEIDIMEMIGKEDDPGSNGEQTMSLHYLSKESGECFSSIERYRSEYECFGDDFHTWAIEWEEGEIRWYFDDVMTRKSALTEDMQGCFNKPQFILVNTALSDWNDNERPDDEHLHKSLHGLTRTLLANMVEGVEKGYSKELDVNGVGYRVEKKGTQLVMRLGYSHEVIMDEIDGITVEVPNPNKIIIHGIDKQVVGQFAAEVRGKRPPEPYKGKGIKYVDEVIRRKVGKTGGKK